jgi:hypothetical protein
MIFLGAARVASAELLESTGRLTVVDFLSSSWTDSFLLSSIVSL